MFTYTIYNLYSLIKVGSFLKDSIHIIRKFGIYIKRHHVILLAFFLPAFILEIAYIAVGIFPFGKWSLLIVRLISSICSLYLRIAGQAQIIFKPAILLVRRSWGKFLTVICLLSSQPFKLHNYFISSRLFD